MFNGEVRTSSELRRILELPRRTWSAEATEALVEKMTALLKRPEGTQRLKPIQAIALYETALCGGLFGPIPVGHGKTLISLLAFWVLEAKQPLLLLPAALIKKTEREMKKYAEHWFFPNNIVIHSYEILGRVQGARILSQGWDVVVADECHKLRNKRAAVTRRMSRFMKETT